MANAGRSGSPPGSPDTAAGSDTCQTAVTSDGRTSRPSGSTVIVVSVPLLGIGALSPISLIRANLGSAPEDLADLIRRREARFGGDLPPSLVEFWQLRARSRPWRALFAALVGPKVFAPTAYLDHPHRWGPEYRLSITVADGAMHMAGETLEGEYIEWYEDEAVVPKATTETWLGLGIGDMAMLDPAVAYSLIMVASGPGEWVELVGDWRDDAGESPIFRAGDDFEGCVNLLGTSVPRWLGLEVDATFARLVAPDMTYAVSLGVALLGRE